MNDDNISTVYVCNICGRQFNKIEDCKVCVKSHEGEKQGLVVELGMKINNQRLQNYGFFERAFTVRPGYSPKSEVNCHGLCGGYPHFTTECLDTPMELMKAKARLLHAAADWSAEYAIKVKELLDELEQGGDGK